MNPKRLRSLFEGLDDLGEYVVVESALLEEDELLASWRHTSTEAAAAYDVWCRRRDGDSYAAYRAYADQADAAQDALAAPAGSGA